MINKSNHKNIKKKPKKTLSVNCYSVLARRVYVARQPKSHNAAQEGHFCQ